MATYETHFNGGRPFLVNIKSDNSVDIINNVAKDKVLSYKPQEIFIGKSPKNKMTEFSGGFGDKFDGNSILLELKQLADNKYDYRFIGSSIISFEAPKIKTFISPVGNNDVPYPYAIDIYDKVYLILDDVIIEWRNQVKYDDPYSYYYDNMTIESPVRVRSTITYSTTPKSIAYKQAITPFYFKNNKQGFMRKMDFTTDAFEDILENFAQKMGYQKLITYTIVESPLGGS